MVATVYDGFQTKPHWGGATSTIDQHVEEYHNEVDTKFAYSAIFKALSTQRSVTHRSNTYRIDRVGAGGVKGRVSGVKLDATRVLNDKMNITVETVLYIRNAFDYQDDWTSPDVLMEIASGNATAFAEKYDQSHIIQLIKARSWVAPAHLKANNAFYDGAEVVCNTKAAPVTIADYEANAFALDQAHKASVNTLVKRKVPMSDMVTLVTSDVYTALNNLPKLKDVTMNSVDGGTYAERRVTRLNGVPVIECTEFPTLLGTAEPGGKHVLSTTANGNAFDCVAADLLCGMITFSKSKTLVTVEAQGFTSRYWDDEADFSNVLDCYTMYTIAARRPDSAVVVRIVAA